MVDEKVIDKSLMVDTMNRPYTQGLFYESQDNRFSIYTLKDYDITVDEKVYPSLKRLYLECEDPTEYTFVKNHLYNLKQWERICENAELKPHIEEWRQELDMKLASSAIQGILEIATDELASGQLQALKFFAKKEYKNSGKAPVGRPKGAKETIGEDDTFSYSKEVADFQKRLQRVK